MCDVRGEPCMAVTVVSISYISVVLRNEVQNPQSLRQLHAKQSCKTWSKSYSSLQDSLLYGRVVPGLDALLLHLGC